MSLKFNTISYTKGEISQGEFTLETTDGTTVNIHVLNDYQSGMPGETKETQLDKIRKLLNGEQTKTVIYCNRDGESEFTIDFDKDKFKFYGGEYGPSFGGQVSMFCSYSKNKEAITKFMMFLLDEL